VLRSNNTDSPEREFPSLVAGNDPRLGLRAGPRSNFISSAGDGSAGADVPPHRRCFVGESLKAT
jgi:hypothetical protein